jgi:hypothetical protein
VRNELSELRARVRSADAALSAAQGDAARVEAGARREAEAQAYLARRAAARQAYPRFAAVAEAQVLGSGDVPLVLAPDTCLLSFVVGGEHAGVFVLGRTQRVAYVALPAPKVLESAVQRLRETWSAASRGADATSALRELSDAVSPAVAACPTTATRLAVSPDGALALLPFDLLEPGGRPLGERYAISYVQSLSVYGLLRRRPIAARHARELLAVGAPRFEAEASAAQSSSAQGGDALRKATLDGAISAMASDDTATRRAFDTLGKRWTPLPGAEREVRAVGRLFTAPAPAARRAGLGTATGRVERQRRAGTLPVPAGRHARLPVVHPSLAVGHRAAPTRRRRLRRLPDGRRAAALRADQ